MINTDRRSFLRSALAAASVAGIPGFSGSGTASAAGLPDTTAGVAAQAQREQAFALFSSFYTDYDSTDLPAFLAQYVQSGSTVFSDATLGITATGYQAIAAEFSRVIPLVRRIVGAGRAFKLFHVTGDPRYGAVVEHVNLRNVFYATNGISLQSVFDLDNGLFARQTDYSDSRELGQSDIVGPANTAGVAFPSAPLHPDGVPRQSADAAPPGTVALATGTTGKPSASPEMVAFAQRFQRALASGNLLRILPFFAEDAVYINPLIHQGPPLYGNYDQSIQIQGIEQIAKLFFYVGKLLPDTIGSSLVHIVGGASGGGFEWKAGGQYGSTGLNRNGLNGCTGLDLFNGKITRMSVKFDTFQLPAAAYDSIRAVLASQGVVDR